MTDIWQHTGDEQQRALTMAAVALCDFPFERFLPRLALEGKTQIRIEWADLSRFGAAEAQAGEHFHVHDGDAIAHPIVREVDGRRAVMGLYYLPPYTKIVLEQRLVSYPAKAHEVLYSEIGHGADYLYMTPDHRRTVVNELHRDDLPPDADVSDEARFTLDGHTCGWFADGIAYEWWVGEAMMELFTEAFTPMTATMELRHPTTPEIAAVVRRSLLGEPEPTPEPAPEPAPSNPVYWGGKRSKVYHDAHKGITAVETYPSSTDAEAAGLRACKVCKP